MWGCEQQVKQALSSMEERTPTKARVSSTQLGALLKASTTLLGSSLAGRLSQYMYMPYTCRM